MVEAKKDDGKQSNLTSVEPVVEDPSQPVSSSPTDPNSTVDGAVSVENLEVVAAPGTAEYQHQLLKGKSPEEVDQLVATLEAATKEQNEELNRQHARLTAATAAPEPAAPEPEVQPYGDDFLGERFQTFEKRLDQRLEAMVAPLRAGEAKSETRSVREGMKTKHRHWDTMEPHIDRLLRDQGLDPTTATEAQLNMLYHTAVGLATESGIDLGGGTPLPAQGEPPVNIPQHRPSAAPLPEPTTEGGPVRELTENERILAATYFPNDQEAEKKYRDLQDAEVDEIVTPGFSKEGWK